MDGEDAHGSLGHDPWQAKEHLDRAVDLPGSRLTKRAELVVLFYEFPMEHADQLSFVGEEPLDPALAAQLLPELTDEIDQGLVEVRPESLGRGAAAEAVAIVVTGFVIAHTTIDFINNVVQLGRNVGTLWRKVRAMPGGSSPVLSLGALEILCAADLESRLGDVNHIVLQWSGDVGGGTRIDFSYSGEDLFMLLFRGGEGTDFRAWVYLVDSYGRILLFSDDLPSFDRLGDHRSASAMPYLLDTWPPRYDSP